MKTIPNFSSFRNLSKRIFLLERKKSSCDKFLNDRLDSVKEKCHELCLKKHKTGCPKKIEACGDLKPQPGNHHLLLKDGNLKNKKPMHWKIGEKIRLTPKSSSGYSVKLRQSVTPYKQSTYKIQI